MNRKEIVDKLATECMGWVMHNHSWTSYWGNPKKLGHMECEVCDWEPDTNWGQMMLCVREMVTDKGWGFRLEGFAVGGWRASLGKTIAGSEDNPLLAIAEAIGRSQGWWEDWQTVDIGGGQVQPWREDAFIGPAIDKEEK